MERNLSRIYTILLTTIILLAMIYGQSILMPVIIAIVITFVIDDVADRCEQLTIANIRLSHRVARGVSIFLILFVLLFIVRMGIGTATLIAGRFPEYRANLNTVVDSVPDQLWVALLGQDAQLDVDDIVNELFNLGTTYVTDYISSIASDILNLFVQAFIVLFYVIFLLSEQGQFKEKMGKMFPDHKRRTEMANIVASIGDQAQKYISVKTYVSVLTGIGSWVVMALFGIHFAIFWAILIFVLNYIPYVGSIIAVVFPVILAVFQFGTFTTAGFLFIALTGIQVLVGYIIEPIVMGNSLDISAFVVLASLSLFGAIWGIFGMIIAIPIVIILIIVMSHFESTRPIAILLTGNGELNFHTHVEENK